MARTPRSAVVLRDATPDDAAFLAEVWHASMRRGEDADRLRDVAAVLARAEQLEGERVLVAEHAGEPAGAVLLRLTTLSPVDLDPVVQVLVPTVLPRLRRHGVGRALMEAAVVFAEEHDAGHVATAAEAGSREANRFMARLGFSQRATYRTASTAMVRAQVGGPRTDPATGARSIGSVLAARRSLRRAQEQRPSSEGQEPTG
ncbi:GNAT family N-acetyltransferase [Nocardioides sp. AX2bis]|uniref:GNAT family N-acetyltransferase n=1 Tax=Nocardioides sp. AX2bis TaxID=2653157 RepID=UPI0012F084E1|nr:GNAT family N-acetyltransferase [Nocardioides sp. AX2bis]VXB69975.1 GNAT family acetyltransferase [Nocardioides sp. AX2bis]